MIGRNCIQKRIKSLHNEEDIPHDILSYIIKAASKPFIWAGSVQAVIALVKLMDVDWSHDGQPITISLNFV